MLQQGPSSVAVNRDSLRLMATRFAELIAQGKATPALFSAWPSAARRQDFDRAIESYRLAALDVNGLLLPVAASWVDAWARDAALEMYADGLHPSANGAYLAALVMYAKLLNKSPQGLPASLQTRGGLRVSVSAPVAAVLQAAAAKVTGF